MSSVHHFGMVKPKFHKNLSIQGDMEGHEKLMDRHTDGQRQDIILSLF